MTYPQCPHLLELGNHLSILIRVRSYQTHIFYRLLATQEYFLPAGIFQDDIEFEFKEQIFIDKKPSYYEFANKILNMTEAEVFAKFASSESIEGIYSNPK